MELPERPLVWASLQTSIFAQIRACGRAVVVCDRGVGSTTLLVGCVVGDVLRWWRASERSRCVDVVCASRRDAASLHRRTRDWLAQHYAAQPVIEHAAERLVFSRNAATCTVAFTTVSTPRRGGCVDALFIHCLEKLEHFSLEEICYVPHRVVAIYQVCDDESARRAHAMFPFAFNRAVYGGYPRALRSDGGLGSLCRWAVCACTRNALRQLVLRAEEEQAIFDSMARIENDLTNLSV